MSGQQAAKKSQGGHIFEKKLIFKINIGSNDIFIGST
jgi:hypothetical protein